MTEPPRGADDRQIDGVRMAFENDGVPVIELQERRYADEQVFVVSVAPTNVARAGEVAAKLDAQFAAAGRQVLTTIRSVAPPTVPPSGPMPDGVDDPRAIILRQLIGARSRTTEIQPSISYIPDSALNIDAVVQPRHQLIFGRRGAGKTALMLEAKRLAETQGARSAWINVHSLRLEPLDRMFLYLIRAIFSAVATETNQIGESPTAAAVRTVSAEVDNLLVAGPTTADATRRLVPEINETLKRFLGVTSLRLNVYIDDFYFVPRQDQPVLLDMLHSCVRDSDCWLKIASIRNLTKWFITSPPTGLETGHDADLIDLDVTLQDPGKAKAFLEAILKEYASRSGVPALTAVYSKAALDRLTLASGGVPRDYLVLAGAAIIRARDRAKGRQVGVQDVNHAAGDAAQVKVQELEEDGSANKGVPEQASRALARVRAFCLDQTEYTYFRVRHRDRDRNPEAFAVLNRLVEFRLLHSVYATVSNQHEAGDASEVFMLDLSQFTGSRLKQKLWVLDIDDGRLFAKRTRDSRSRRSAEHARELVAIFRVAPEFELKRLGDLVATFDTVRSEILRLLQRGSTRTVAELVSELAAPFRQVAVTLDDLIDRGVVESAQLDDREVFQLAVGPRKSTS